MPGIEIGEHFPLLARRTDKLAIVRSMTHGDVNHTTATHYLLTGQPSPPLGDRSAARLAALGSVLAKLGRGHGPLPPYVTMRPKLENDVPRFVEESHGQTAGWLGQSFDPLMIDADPSRGDYRVGDFSLPAEISARRLDDRKSLLAHVDRQRRAMEQAASVGTLDAYYSRALRAVAFGHRQRRVRLEAGAGRAARPVRPQSAWAIGAASPPAGRAGRAAGHRLLAQRRDQERAASIGTRTAAISATSRRG